MKRFLHNAWREDDGVLSFEWVLLVTLLVIGIVGGLAGARDAVVDELGDIAEATLNFDQSYFLPGLTINGDVIFPDQEFEDDGFDYVDCGRSGVPGQDPSDDGLDGG